MKTISSIEDEIRDLQIQFDQTQVNEDFDTIEKLLAPNVLFIKPKGFITDINEWLSVHKSGEYKQILLRSADTNIRTYDNTAIVNEIKISECEFKGEKIKGKFRVNQVWVKQNKDWLLESMQFTSIAEQ